LRFAAGEPQGSLMAGHAKQGVCPEGAKRVEGQPKRTRHGRQIESEQIR
jgi:hypothetical protein